MTSEDHLDRVRLVLPPVRDYVAVARFAAGVMAVRADFDIEEVEDLQLAVDELYASSGVLDEEVAATEFELVRDGRAVTISLTPVGGALVSAGAVLNGVGERDISRQLLSVLVDEHGASNGDERPSVWLRKSHHG